jgi:alanine-synthesizing transaminase
MRFSRRASWDLRPNRLAQLLEARRLSGEPILDLTESNPTRADLPYPAAQILEALAQRRVLCDAPAAQGLPVAREAIAAYYTSRGYPVDPARVFCTASTSEAYSFAFKLLCDPGDEILVPSPSYPLFEFLAALESVRPVPYPLVYHDGWEIDLAALRDAVSPATRILVVVNPNNPTGSFLKKKELATLREIGLRHGLTLVSDEVFGDYAFGPDPERVQTLATEEAVSCLSLSGLSKVVGLPQVKLGWVVVSGPDAAAVCERLEVVADTYLSVSTTAQLGAPALLALRPRLGRAIAERIGENWRCLPEILGARTPCSVLRCEGGWYATLQLPRTRSEEEWVLGLLETQGVLVHPGHFFDFPGEPYAVLSLLTAPATWRQGVARLGDFLSA